MNIGPMLSAMRDPAGVPGLPVLFEILFVATWVLHMAFVLLTLGACTLAIVGFCKRESGPHWGPLSRSMTSVAKVGVSMLIVLGVAPLLFTQVIYDPGWYASNVLSASWAIGFILTLIVGYCLWFYFSTKNLPGARSVIVVAAVCSLGIFLLDGLIMHALTYQSLLPERWMEWYAPGGVVDTSGAKLHAIQWPRYVFFISLSAPALGLFLLAYADYFSARPDVDRAYLDFARTLGGKAAFVGFLVSTALFVWWLLVLSPESHLTYNPFGWLAGLSLPIVAVVVQRKAAPGSGYLLLALGAVPLLLISVWREVIRVVELSPYGYTIHDYKVNMDWPSFILFLTTLVGVGSLVGGFYLTLGYVAGRTQGVYMASGNVSRLGAGAVGVLILWIAIFFVYGATIYVKNIFPS
jgi:hypothetical protein